MTASDMKTTDEFLVTLGDPTLDYQSTILSGIYLDNARWITHIGLTPVKDDAGNIIEYNLLNPHDDYGTTVGLSDRERVLYEYLLRFKFNADSKIRPSLKRLAGMMGKSVDSVRRAKNGLVEKGLLKITSRPGKPHIFDLSEITRQTKLWNWFWSQYSPNGDHVFYSDLNSIPKSVVPKAYVQSFIWHYILELPDTDRIINFRDGYVQTVAQKLTPCNSARGAENNSDPLQFCKGTPCNSARGIYITNIDTIETKVSIRNGISDRQENDIKELVTETVEPILDTSNQTSDSDVLADAKAEVENTYASAIQSMRERLNKSDSARRIEGARAHGAKRQSVTDKRPSEKQMRLLEFTKALLEHWSPFNPDDFRLENLATKKPENSMYGQYVDVAKRLNDVSFAISEQALGEFMPSDVADYTEWLLKDRGYTDAGLPAVKKWVDTYIQERIQVADKTVAIPDHVNPDRRSEIEEQRRKLMKNFGGE